MNRMFHISLNVQSEIVHYLYCLTLKVFLSFKKVNFNNSCRFCFDVTGTIKRLKAYGSNGRSI